MGQVRFERQEPAWVISYSLAPQFRKRGLGRPLLKVALLKMRSEYPGALVLGRVKPNNLPSRKIFESLDFDTLSDGEGIAYQRIL